MPASALSRSTRSISSRSLVSAGTRCSKLSMPGLDGRLDLGAHIGGARRVLADQDDGKARRAAGGGAERRDRLGDAGTQFQGGGAPVDQAGRHRLSRAGFRPRLRPAAG